MLIRATLRARERTAVLSRTLSDLTQALLIGMVVSLPFQLLLWQPHCTDRYTFFEHPGDHSAVQAWIENQPDYLDAELRVFADELVIHYKKPHLWSKPPRPLFHDLGYSLHSSRQHQSSAPDFSGAFLLISVLATQMGFFLMYLRRRGSLPPPQESVQQRPRMTPGRGFLLGLAFGVTMIVLGLLHDWFYVRWFGGESQADRAGPWAAVRNFSVVTQALIVLLGSLLAPVCEELFFRGLLLRRYLHLGRGRLGFVLTSLLFAALHFTPGSPAVLLLDGVTYLLFGLLLASVYTLTQSLPAAILAHALNNSVAFALLLLQ